MKPRNPDIVAKEVDSIADNLGMPIDEGIKKLVVALRVWNFPTDGSCEGHLLPREACPYPWIDVCAPEESEAAWQIANSQLNKRLKEQITKYYRAVHTDALFQLQPIGIFGAFRLVPCRFDVDSASEELLEQNRKNFDDFADFLLRQVN